MSRKISTNQSTGKSHGEVIIEDEPTKPNIDINLHPDGNQVDIDINGTVLNVTKRSFDITIGKFSISLSSQSTINPLVTSTHLLPSPILAVAVLSVSTGNPLHIVTGDSGASVIANLSLSKLMIIVACDDTVMY